MRMFSCPPSFGDRHKRQVDRLTRRQQALSNLLHAMLPAQLCPASPRAGGPLAASKRLSTSAAFSPGTRYKRTCGFWREEKCGVVFGHVLGLEGAPERA